VTILDAKQYSEASRIEMSRYLIVIEETGTGYSAYSPDLPGCIATGKTREGVERGMHDAIEFHLDGLRRVGEPIPSPTFRSVVLRSGRLIQSCSRGRSPPA
jgi:predicted RNase H-like HicB family nuclease